MEAKNVKKTSNLLKNCHIFPIWKKTWANVAIQANQRWKETLIWSRLIWNARNNNKKKYSRTLSFLSCLSPKEHHWIPQEFPYKVNSCSYIRGRTAEFCITITTVVALCSHKVSSRQTRLMYTHLTETKDKAFNKAGGKRSLSACRHEYIWGTGTEL